MHVTRIVDNPDADILLQCFQYIANSPPSPLNHTDILFQIGHVYEQQKDVGTRFAALSPSVSDIFQYDGAKRAYQRVLERDPDHAKVLQQLGWLYHQESTDYNSQERAIEYLEKSVNSGKRFRLNHPFSCH